MCDLHSEFPIEAIGIKKPEKNQGFNGIRTRDLRDTGIAEVTDSNPVEALIFFRLLYSNCVNWKFTAKITYHLHI